MIMLIASILATFPWAVQDMHDGKTGLAPVEYRSRGPHSFDVLHYDVALDLYPEAESLVGVVGILFESDKLGLDQITLDLFALGVDSAWDSTGPLAFTQSDSTVDLELSSPRTRGIYYGLGGLLGPARAQHLGRLLLERSLRAMPHPHHVRYGAGVRQMGVPLLG